MYRPGKILRAGGGDPAQASAAVIDMTAANPAWREIAPMSFARRRMNLTILADGTVMAIGGTLSADDESHGGAGRRDLGSGDRDMDDGRLDGRGADVPLRRPYCCPTAGSSSAAARPAGRLRAQIYSPPYLFKGARPTIGSSPGTAAYGSSFAVTSPDASSVATVALLRPSAATHAFDQNQRYVPLAFTRSGTT